MYKMTLVTVYVTYMDIQVLEVGESVNTDSLVEIKVSHLTRKPAVCICKNKGADQLGGIFFSLHRFYNPSTSLIRNTKPLYRGRVLCYQIFV